MPPQSLYGLRGFYYLKELSFTYKQTTLNILEVVNFYLKGVMPSLTAEEAIYIQYYLGHAKRRLPPHLKRFSQPTFR